MSLKPEMLDLLAQMQEDWQATTVALVDLAVATTLQKHGLSRVVLDNEEMQLIGRHYVVQRNLVLAPGGARWEITVTPREVAINQEVLPL